MRSVLAPKLAFLPHAVGAAQRQPLLHLNVFSSVSAFLGTRGQSNYASANMALGAWSEALQQRGMAGEGAHIPEVPGCSE